VASQRVGAAQIQRAVVAGARARLLGAGARGVAVAHLQAFVAVPAGTTSHVVPLQILQRPLVEPGDEGQGVDPPNAFATEGRAAGEGTNDARVGAHSGSAVARVRHHGHHLRVGNGIEHRGLVRRRAPQERHVVHGGPEHRGVAPHVEIEGKV